MPNRCPDDPITRLREVAQAPAGLDALILYGSRARLDATSRSDWDVGFLADGALDVNDLHARIVEALGDDRVDLVDLGRASGQLRYRAAREGRTIFERTPRSVERFRLDAIAYWLDMAFVIRAEYESGLEKLSR
jgi:predicted nucleotidyltransferase